MRVHDGQMGPYGSAVQQYADAGIPTFPLGGEDGKRPLVCRPMLFGVKASVKVAARYSAANIGFWCGNRSGLTVMDIDTGDERELHWVQDTFGESPVIVRTGSGKYHVWYRHNGERRRIRPFTGHAIDLLGTNGLCVAPPSIRPGAEAYDFVSGGLNDLGRLPIIRADALLALVGPISANLRRTEPSAIGRDLGQQAIAEGVRNRALFGIGRRLAHGCASEAELKALLHTENCQWCIPPLELSEVDRIAWSIWRYKLAGTLWSGSGQKLVLDSGVIEGFMRSGDSDGLMLYVRSMQAHDGQRNVFALAPTAMARNRVIGTWSPRRYRAAIGGNLQAGVMERVHSGGKGIGDAAQYRFIESKRSAKR